MHELFKSEYEKIFTAYLLQYSKEYYEEWNFLSFFFVGRLTGQWEVVGEDWADTPQSQLYYSPEERDASRGTL